MPEEVACRYVCIPHVPGFWDHVLVGTRAPPQTNRMIGSDDYMPKLFNVSLGSYKFHWCCFVYKTQIILAMWCSLPGREPQVFTLVNNALKNFTVTLEFRRMVFYLSRWFTVQYVTPSKRALKIVLDCKPSEGCIVPVITLLASKSGMTEVTTPDLFRHRVKDDTNDSFNIKSANIMFSYPIDHGVEGNYVNIVEAFRESHNGNCIDRTRSFTTLEYYNRI